jgi:hypothetical protein
MVTSQQWSAIAKLLGKALLDIAAELEDERELPEPELLSPVAQIGLGGNGADRGYPECRICYARGGGGHGGFCPNSGMVHGLWVTRPPTGYLMPDYPLDREPW